MEDLMKYGLDFHCYLLIWAGVDLLELQTFSVIQVTAAFKFNLSLKIKANVSL